MSTYAVIKTGGKQYKVQKGDVIDVELLNDADSEQVAFEDVLFLSVDKDGKEAEHQVGAPLVSAATVKAEVMGQVRGPKVIAFKYKRRKDSHCKKGHRQNYTRVKILDIVHS